VRRGARRDWQGAKGLESLAIFVLVHWTKKKSNRQGWDAHFVVILQFAVSSRPAFNRRRYS
jgi:hypothetical protein